MSTSHTLELNEPPVSISMSAESLVISPGSQLDLDATSALVSATAAAVSSGLTVMVDLDPDTPSDDLVAHGPVHVTTTTMLHRPGNGVQVLGAGYVRLDMVDAMWTIDLDRRRLFRSEKPIDPYFVAEARWTPIRALWVNCETVTALDANGTYLCCDAAWSIEAGHGETTA